MNKQYLKKILSCSVLGLSLTIVGFTTAQAMPVTVTSGQLNEVNNVKTVGAVGTDASVDTLNAQLTTLLIPQLGSQMIEDTQKLQTTLSQLMNTLDSRLVTQKVQESTLNKLNGVSTGASGCNVITGNIGTGSMGATMAKWREQASQDQLDMLAGNSITSPSHTGRDAAEIARNSIHCSIGATDADVTSGGCSTKTINNSPKTGQSTSVVSSEYANKVGADLNFNTIWNAQNGVLTTDGVTAANAFVINAFEDHALGAMPATTGLVTIDLQRKMAQRNTIISQRSIAFSAINEIIISEKGMDNDSMGHVSSVEQTVDSTSNSDSDTYTDLDKWGEATAAQTIGMIKDTNGKYFPNGLSLSAYEELRAKAWFWNLNWLGNINTEDTPQLLKEITMMDSYNVYQTWELKKQSQLTNVLLAVIVDIMESQRTKDTGE
jgi:hypothetical protein